MNDLISRRATIDALVQLHEETGVKTAQAIRIVREMPDAAPETKTAEWLKISPAGIYECSGCGQNVMTSDIECYKFCHGCGRRMVNIQ